MILGRIHGATHKIGKPPHLIVRLDTTPNGPVYSSAWFATPKELERIAGGAPIYLHLYGGHPSTAISVGAVPRDEDEKPSPPAAIVPDSALRMIEPPAPGSMWKLPRVETQWGQTVANGVLLGVIITAPYWLAMLAAVLGFR